MTQASSPQILIALDSGSVYNPESVVTGTVFFIPPSDPTQKQLPYGDTLFLDYVCEDSLKGTKAVFSRALKLILDKKDDAFEKAFLEGQKFSYPFALKIASNAVRTFNLVDYGSSKYQIRHYIVSYFDYQKGKEDPSSKIDQGVPTFGKIEIKISPPLNERPDTRTIPLFWQQNKGCMSKPQTAIVNVHVQHQYKINKGMGMEVEILNPSSNLKNEVKNMHLEVQMHRMENGKLDQISHRYITLADAIATDFKISFETNCILDEVKLPSIQTAKFQSSKEKRFQLYYLLKFQLGKCTKGGNKSNIAVHHIPVKEEGFEITEEPIYSFVPPSDFFEWNIQEKGPIYQKNLEDGQVVEIGKEVRKFVSES